MEKSEFKELICTRHNSMLMENNEKKPKTKTVKNAKLNEIVQKAKAKVSKNAALNEIIQKAKAKAAKNAALNEIVQKARTLSAIKSDNVLEGRKELLENLMFTLNQNPELGLGETAHEDLKQLILDAYKQGVIEISEAEYTSWGASAGLSVFNILAITTLVVMGSNDLEFLSGILSAGLIKLDSKFLGELKKIIGEYYRATGKKMELCKLFEDFKITNDELIKAKGEIDEVDNSQDAQELKKTL